MRETTLTLNWQARAMASDKDKLQALRQEIDRIDNSIHDLIMERTLVVEEVRHAKRGDSIKIRPSREAEILYRLMARHTGSFPKRELGRIWRELIVATLRFEGPFSVAVSPPEGENEYWELTRGQYGSFTPMTRHASTRSVVEAVRTQQATVGILPLPRPDDVERWWPLMVSDAPDMPRIIARLPFIPGDGNTNAAPQALVICSIDQEKTGRDHSFLAIETKEDIGNNAINKALGDAGLSTVFNQLWHEPNSHIAWIYLIEIDGFIETDSDAMQRLKDALGKRINRIVQMGGYAIPLGLDDVAS